MQGTTWGKALEEFAAAQVAHGIAGASIDKQQRILRRAALELGGEPMGASREQLSRWVDQHPGTVRSVKSVRQTLRAFYRWAVAAGYINESPAPPPPPVTRYRLEQRWQDALSDFEAGQLRSRLAASTIAQRVKYVTRLAREAESGPWELSGDELRGWLDGLGCSPPTRAAHRVAVRAFYRWAVKDGRILEDPAADDDRVQRLPVPVSWAPELDAYLRYLRSVGRPASTVRSRRDQLARFARDHRSLPPFEVTLDDLAEWLAGKRWAAETRRGNRSALVSFYRWAEATGRVELSPAAELPVTRGGQPRPRPALEHEVRVALAGATPRERLAIRLAAELGMRRGEVACVHTRDLVQLPGDDSWWLLVHGKGNRQRRLPLQADLATTLRALPAGYAFPGRDGGHLSPRYLGKLITGLLPEGVTMHALRHRFATRAYNVDRDVFAVQHFLGHASPATTQRYVLVADARLRELGAAVAS